MARGLRLWLTLVALGLVVAFGLVQVWAVSIRSVALGPADSTEAAYAALARRAARTATAVQRVRWARSIQERVGETLLVLGEDVPVAAESRTRVREARARLGPGQAVAVAVVQLLWGRPEDGTRFGSRGGGYGIDYLLPEGGPCQVAVHVPGGASTRRVLDGLLDPDRVLGPCWWVARYGPPGPAVRSWLRKGAGHVGMDNVPSTSRVGSAALEGDGPDPMDRLETACLAGDAGACTRAVEPLRSRSLPWLGEPLPDDPVLYERSGYRAPGSFGGAGRHLLADMEQAMGRDAFARFWRTDAPLPDALSEALGEPVGEWIRDWARERFGEPGRAGVAFTDILLSLLAIGLLAGSTLVIDRLRGTSS